VADLHRLLDLQDHDTTLDHLRHRRESLPERAALAGRQQELQRLDARLTDLQGRLTELARGQQRIEDEVATIDAKSATETKKLNSGSVTAPREIQSLSEEIDALGRRKRALEDQEIELMEQAEPLGAEAEQLAGQREEAAADAQRLADAVAEQERAIDEEIAAATAQREAAVADIPDDLLARYERLRGKLGGVAVARLEGDLCTGCHVRLPAMEFDVIKHTPEGEVVLHEDCGRILVR
jgi:predicted  nucleic acid-binding Zn-ribbon protein